MHLRAALLDRRDAVGVDDRVRDRAVLDDAAVDEDVLRPARRPLLAERGDVAEHREVAASLPHLDQIRRGRRRADRSARAAWPAGGHSTARAAAARQREADLRIAERQLRDEARDLRRLGRVRLEELAARRQVVEEIGDLDRRALRRADLAHRRDGAAVDADLGARSASPRARVRSVKCETDAMLGSASPRKPSVANRRRGRRRRRILLVACRSIASRASSGAIPSPSSSTRSSFLPPSSTAIAMRRAPASMRVLDQLLDDRGRALDDLAGGDLVREMRRQQDLIS